MIGLVGKIAYFVDLNETQDNCCSEGTIIAEALSEKGFRRLTALVNGKIIKFSQEFAHHSKDAALLFYALAKPVAEEIKAAQKENEDKIKLLWEKMGIAPQFEDLGKEISKAVNNNTGGEQ